MSSISHQSGENAVRQSVLQCIQATEIEIGFLRMCLQEFEPACLQLKCPFRFVFGQMSMRDLRMLEFELHSLVLNLVFLVLVFRQSNIDTCAWFGQHMVRVVVTHERDGTNRRRGQQR